MPEIALREVLYIFDADGERQKISLSDPKETGGLLSTCKLDVGELELMLSLVATLGSGEAAAIAAAQSRGHPLATDDKAARDHPAAKSCRVVTTPDLLRSWAEGTNVAPSETAEAIENVEAKARFRPHQKDPNYRWWISYGQTSNTEAA